MPKKTKPEVPPKVTFVTSDVQTLYVNHAQLVFSQFDANMLIGEVQTVNTETGLAVTPRAKLIMSHEFFVEFASLIARNLKHFEEDSELQEVESDAPST